MSKANLDPKNINARLYNQVDAVLSYLEARDNDEEGVRVTLKERIAALIAIARIQTAFVSLRKEKVPDDDVPGSAVRKYATAFANDGRRRAARTGRGAVAARQPEPDDDGEGMGLSIEDTDEE